MAENEYQLTQKSYERLQESYGLTRAELDEMSGPKLARSLRKLDFEDRPTARIENELVALRGREGRIPEECYRHAFSQVERMRREAQTGRTAGLPTGLPLAPAGAGPVRMRTAGLNPDNSGWTALGPGNIGGRTRMIVVDPGNRQRMFTATAGGGVWRSTDGGQSWRPTDDLMGNLAICSLVMDPNDANTLYAGSGEGFSNADAIRGDGIYRTRDGGVTWTALAATSGNPNFHFVNSLAMSPDGATLLAGTTTGIFRSTDGGQTWTRASQAHIGNLVFHPTDSNRAIAGGLRSGDAFVSSNAGASWSRATPGASGGRRVQVCYAAADPSITYASVEASRSQIWRSTDGGASYTRQGAADGSGNAANFLGQQGWYDNAIWAGDPTDSDLVIVGGIDLWRSTDAGDTLSRISRWWDNRSAHADHHAIVSDPAYNGTNNRRVYFGNDGGIYRVDDATTVSELSGWVNLNSGYAATQFYYAAGHVGTNTILGGTQDNGTLRYTPAQGTNGWNETYGGDGGACASDPVDPQIWYGEYVYMELFRDTSGGAQAALGSAGITGNFWNGSAWAWKPEPFTVPDVRNQNAQFIAPFEMDPNEPERLLGGALSLWRTNDAREPNTNTSGPSWEAIKPSIGTSARTHSITAIAIAGGNSDFVYVGHANGNVYRTRNATDATPSWTRIDTNGISPNRACLCLKVHPDDPNAVYAGFAGYEPDNLWFTDDGGQSWANLSAGLPDVPIRAVALHPQRSSWIYLGTQVGIFASEDGGVTWSPTNEGPANVAVFDLIWMRCKLICVSHGRGMFEIHLPITNALPQPELRFDGTEDYTTSAGEFTRYKLSVVNRADYPDSLLRKSPDLPPCGTNANSARTWVDIFNADTNQRIYGFCALGAASDLGQLWFGLPRGDSPPNAVYVVLRDRRCEASYQSAPVAISGGVSGPVTITNPVPGERLVGPAVTFQWKPGNRSVSAWWLYVGSTPGGREHYDSGSLGTALFDTVEGLPMDGSQVHVRLWHREAGVWQSTDAQYTAASAAPPKFVSPAAGSTLAERATFEWRANGTVVSQWWLYVGSSPGGNDIYDSGSLGTRLTETVTGLPGDGRAVHVRLWYRQAGNWRFVDSQHQAMTSGKPAIISPPPGTALGAATATFEWSAIGAAVAQYWLYVGTAAGAKDLYNSGSLGTQTTHTVSGLPVDGSQVHIRLWYRSGGAWLFNDHVYVSG